MNWKATHSAVTDFLTIFASQRWDREGARECIERDCKNPVLHLTKRNGAQVYRARGGRAKYYLLVCPPNVVAIGPPAETYPIPPSSLKPKKPGESRYWWIAEDGDVKIKHETNSGNLEKRSMALPEIAELRALQQRLGLTHAEVAKLTGILDKNRWESLARGSIFSTENRDTILEGIARATKILRNRLGLPEKRPDPPSPSTPEPPQALNPPAKRQTSARIKESGVLSDLHCARLSTGLSRAAVADATGIAPRLLRRWETDGRAEGNPLIEILRKVAEEAELEYLPYRATRGFSQDAAAEALGIHRMTISEAECKEVQRSMDALRKISGQK